MKTYFYSPIPIRIRHLVCAWGLLACFFLTSGCSVSQTVSKTTKTIKKATKEITRELTFSDDGLLRKVGVLNFENRSLHQERNLEQIFNKGIPDYLNANCSGILVESPNNGGNPVALAAPPRLPSGQTDNFALTIIGRQHGINAMVSGTLEDIRVINELRGILWTKDTHHTVQVLVRIEVFDMKTGTKIVDDTVQRDVEVDDIDYQLIRENKDLNLPQINETLLQLMADIGDSICDAVRDQPWNGFIIDADGETYTISSGNRVGLRPGTILEVYDSSRIIEGLEGQRFFVPGLKIGEVEVVAISADSAEAKRIEGEAIKKGSTVRRK